MNKAMIYKLLIILPLAAAFAGCAKMDEGSYANPGEQQYGIEDGSIIREDMQAVATLRSQEGIRYLRLDPFSVGYILNPDAVEDIPDVTRVFVQYKEVSAERPSFCTESVWVDWAMPLEVGYNTIVSWEEGGQFVDPVNIERDWITSLEDGFLTLHYMIASSGDKKHRFVLYSSFDRYHFYLVHSAGGDMGGSLTDGIVTFPVEHLLPETGGETVTLSLTYLDLNNTQKTLTVDYRTPK